MYLSNPLTKSGICEEIDRNCQSAGLYSIEDKVARINDGLDRYFFLASKACGVRNFDDTLQSSPPIDTQNLVSGTFRYKMSSFTAKVLQLLRISALSSDGIEYDLIPEDIQNLPGSFTELYKSTITGPPAYYLVYGDFIYVRPTPDYNETAGLVAYFNRAISKFDLTKFTVTIASPGVFSATNTLAAGDTVVPVTDGALPTGLTAKNTYYIISAGLSASAFEVALTSGGSAINTSGSQSGNHAFVQTNKEPGIPGIHHTYLARYASLPWMIENEKPQVEQIKRLIGSADPRNPYYGGDELAITEFFSGKNKDISKRMTMSPVMGR